MKKSIIAVAAFAAVSSFANTTGTNTTREIIISATRSLRSTETVPIHSTVITGEEIAKRNYTTVTETLGSEAGIYFRNYTDNPSQANIDMRGFGENSHGRVLVLLNGRKLNSPDLATVNWSQISLRNIERIEVLRGPGTAMYGDNANGGVVNIITKEGTKEPEYGADIVIGSHQFNDGNIHASGQLKGLGYSASLSHQSADGYRDRSRYDNLIGSLNLDGALAKNLAGRLALSGVKRQYQLPGDLTKTQKDADRRQSVDDSDVKDQAFNGDLGLKLMVADDHAFHLDGGLWIMEQEANLNREFGPFATFMDADKISGTISPKYTTTVPLGKLDNEFTLGSDIRREVLEVRMYANEARNIDRNNAEVTQDTFDLYAADSLYLSEKMILSGAGRLNWSSVSVTEELPSGATVFDGSTDRDEQAVSVGLTWLPAEKTKIYVKADRFYRYPFVDEQASYLGFLASGFVDLDPETGYNLEIGTDLTPVKELRLQASAYYMPMKNEIAFDPINFVNQNLDDTLRQGFEVSADYMPVELLSLYANYIFTLAEFDSGVNDGNQVPGAPKHRAQLRADLHLTKALTLTTGIRFTGKQYPINDNGNNTGGQDAYTLVDIKLSYANTCKGCEYRLFAGIDNLFANEYDYYQISNGAGTAVNYYPAAGRTYRTGVALVF
ncbi:MAG: TonB-dependent receptor [Kiritimatiellales bacterium]|nr:TonB-dependent receptor [Kiritimatiellales bacterium]